MSIPFIWCTLVNFRTIQLYFGALLPSALGSRLVRSADTRLSYILTFILKSSRIFILYVYKHAILLINSSVI